FRSRRTAPSSPRAPRASRRAGCAAWSALRSPSCGLARGREGAIEDFAIRVEGEHAARFVLPDPAHLVVLVIMLGGVAAGRLHQEEVDELVHPLARRGEPVISRADVAEDADLESRLLLDLAERGVLDLLAVVGSALRKDPGAVSVAAREDDLARTVSVAQDDATRGDRVADA